MDKKYIVIQGAIPYVNDSLHLGHALLALYSDVVTRYYRLNPNNTVILTTGADQHGVKNLRKAESVGQKVEEFVEKMSAEFQTTFKKIGIGYDRFTKTASPDHRRRSQMIWQMLLDKGLIYKSDYEADYCVGCESFKTATVVGQTNGVCPDHNQKYQRLSEENYFLKSSQFKDQLRSLIESDQLRIKPDSAKKAALKLLEEMEDDSVSRPKSSVSWGIEAPNDPNQIMYVWIEALFNYLTVLDYPDENKPDFDQFWPAELIVIGRDILRFHALLLPIILLALDLPVFKNLFVHGLITVDGQKMSKTIGNVVRPVDITEKLGNDSLRYYLLSRIKAGENGNYSSTDLIDSYNNEIANDLGNLIYRLQKLCQQSDLSEFDQSDFSKTEPVDYHQNMTDYRFDRALEAVWQQIRDLNKQLEVRSPWKIDDKDEKIKILNQFVGQLVSVSYFLRPFLPDTADIIDQIFGSGVLAAVDQPPFRKVENNQTSQ